SCKDSGMRNVILILICLSVSILALGQSQETPRPEDKPIIESVDVSGVAEDRISNDARDAMHALVGQRFDQLAADEVGFRIQKEASQRISTIRQLPGTMPDQVKLIFEFSNETI